MKTITTIAAILMTICSVNAKTEEGKSFTKYVGEQSTYEVFDSIYQKPIEYIIAENNSIIETEAEGSYETATRTIEEVIEEDQRIIEATIPLVEPLDFKIIDAKPASKITNSKATIYGNL